MEQNQATFTKLNDGSWGVRVPRTNGYMPKAGEFLIVARRDGSATPKEIGRVIWADDKVALATIRS